MLLNGELSFESGSVDTLSVRSESERFRIGGACGDWREVRRDGGEPSALSVGGNPVGVLGHPRLESSCLS